MDGHRVRWYFFSVTYLNNFYFVNFTQLGTAGNKMEVGDMGSVLKVFIVYLSKKDIYPMNS